VRQNFQTRIDSSTSTAQLLSSRLFDCFAGRRKQAILREDERLEGDYRSFVSHLTPTQMIEISAQEERGESVN
jgi:hypothetical protein